MTQEAPPTSAAAAAEPTRDERTATAVARWRRDLVDLGGPNNLLWFSDLPSGTLELTHAHPGGIAMLLSGRPVVLSEMVREPRALAEAARRARAIRDVSRELAEERGVGACFLVAGIATWRTPGRAGGRVPAAPVLLRAVDLRPRSLAEEDFDLDVSHSVEINPALEELLRAEHGITFDADQLAAKAYGRNGFDPRPVYEQLARICADVPGFTITPRLLVGTFTYTKVPLVSDLLGPVAPFAASDLVAAAAGDEGARAAVRRELPDVIADADLARERLVLDADADQARVVAAARAGVSLVVDAPPGTGKTQTIANTAAALAVDGKRVLVLSEKRSALDDLVTRLGLVGLDRLVLDAGDAVRDRAHLAADVLAVIDSPTKYPAPDPTQTIADLQASRSALAAAHEAMHADRRPWGVTAYEVASALTSLSERRPTPTSHVRVAPPVLDGLDRATVARCAAALTTAAERHAWSEDVAADPWFGARVVTEEDARESHELLDRLASPEGVERVETVMRALASDANLPAAQTPEGWGAILDLTTDVRDTLDVFTPAVYSAPLTEMLEATSGDYRAAHGSTLGVLARSQRRRAVRDLLRPGRQPEDLHEALASAARTAQAWRDAAQADTTPRLPKGIDEARVLVEAVAGDLRRLGERLRGTADGGDLMRAPLPELRARLHKLVLRADRLDVLPGVTSLLDEVRAAGLGELIGDLAAREVPASAVQDEVDFVWWASLGDHLDASDPVLGAHDGDALRSTLGDYGSLDRHLQQLTARRVLAATNTALRNATSLHPEQVDVIRAEAARTQGRPRIADVLTGAADVALAAKPIWMMSPLVVPSLVPRDTRFDVVLVDEASMLGLPQLVPALLRTGQVVVFGDAHQLRPTGFSTTPAAEAELLDDPVVTRRPMAPVLDTFAEFLAVQPLSWHYRSYDERLVDLVDREVYEGRLRTFPGTARRAPVQLEVVRPDLEQLSYDDPVVTTQGEVDRVVRLVVTHARTNPHESLGVVTLGPQHATRISEALRLALASESDPLVRAFFDPSAERRFFVKDAGKAQGDVRDVVIVSVGYARGLDGRLLHRFGPLNVAGGERRLTVALTRATRRVVLVASFAGSDLEPERLQSTGSRLLRTALLRAEEAGHLEKALAEAVEETSTEDGPAIEDPIVAELVSRLRARGLVVRLGVGGAHPPLDLVVHDPLAVRGRHVAVDLDGPAHAGAISTRERDRLRPEQLSRLGWKYVRVWTTDLFRTPERDVARIVAATHAERRKAAPWRKDIGGLSPHPQERRHG